MYNTDYFYNMLRMYSSTAKTICDIRWQFIADAQASTVLDYGSGCGFFKAFAPAHCIKCDTFDLMPVPQTGITQDKYDIICFWDVLEHCYDFFFLEELLAMTNWVAVTVPIKPDGIAWENYKHYKPLEHIHHFQKDSLCALLHKFGFELFKEGTPECPPREMIGSFLFKRINTAGFGIENCDGTD